MSFTNVAEVRPSLFQSSGPLRPSSAMRNTSPPASVRRRGLELSFPGRMSATRSVPEVVPSLRHSSSPWDRSSAENNRVSPASVSQRGPNKLGKPFTRAVPEGAPSLLQSSHVWVCLPVCTPATKNRVFPAFAISGKQLGPISAAQYRTRVKSFSRTVPAAVPSLLHSSLLPPSAGVKNVVPPTSVKASGLELVGPGRMSFTRDVPDAIPFVLHNSVP